MKLTAQGALLCLGLMACSQKTSEVESAAPHAEASSKTFEAHPGPIAMPPERAPDQAASGEPVTHDKKAIRIRLAEYLKMGEKLELRCSPEGDATEAEIEAWRRPLVAYVREVLDESELVQLNSGAGLVTYSGGMEGERLKLCTGVHIVNIRLNELIGKFD